MVFVKIAYEDLNAKQKEIYNYQKVASLLNEYGYNCIKLSDDWEGADFLAYHFTTSVTMKVQLKSRIELSTIYQNKNIFLAFPIKSQWYLIDHDLLLQWYITNTKISNSTTWQQGKYRTEFYSKKMLTYLSTYKI